MLLQHPFPAFSAALLRPFRPWPREAGPVASVVCLRILRGDDGCFFSPLRTCSGFCPLPPFPFLPAPSLCFPSPPGHGCSSSRARTLLCESPQAPFSSPCEALQSAFRRSSEGFAVVKKVQHRGFTAFRRTFLPIAVCSCHLPPRGYHPRLRPRPAPLFVGFLPMSWKPIKGFWRCLGK